MTGCLVRHALPGPGRSLREANERQRGGRFRLQRFSGDRARFWLVVCRTLYGHQQEAYLGSVLDQLQLPLLIDAVKLEEVRVVEGDATQMKGDR